MTQSSLMLLLIIPLFSSSQGLDLGLHKLSLHEKNVILTALDFRQAEQKRW